jgi:hypothetical protein
MSGRRSTLSRRRDTKPSRTTARKIMAVVTGRSIEARAILMGGIPGTCRPRGRYNDGVRGGEMSPWAQAKSGV